MLSRVLFVGATGQVSGAEAVMVGLVSEALARGDQVVVACPEGPLRSLLPRDCAHVALPLLVLSGRRGIARGFGVARLLIRWIVAARVLARQARVGRTVTVVNSLLALPAVRLARVPGGAAWLVHDTVVDAKRRWVIRLCRGGFRRVVAVSEASATPLRALGLEVVVAQHGVRWPVEAVGTALHSPPVVGALALLTPWKGHRVLLEAVAQLSGVRLELAGGHFSGDADYVAELRARAGEPDLNGRVRFLGHVDPASALANWDVMVSASVEPEAGPLAVLEAMAYGVPVVGTAHGGTRWFLRGDAGLLVPPGDPAAIASAISCLLDDPRLRRQVVDTGRRRIAEEHDIATTLPRMFEDLTGWHRR